MKYFPHTTESFLTEAETTVLRDFSEQNHDAFEQSSGHIADPRWSNKVAYLNTIQHCNENIYRLMMTLGNRLKSYMLEIQPTVTCYVEKWQFSKWSTGDQLDPPHADNCELDGSDNKSPWRNYGFVLYLNDDFEGGELFYPNYNLSIKPKPGMLAVHTAGLECMHGVKQVTKGIRHTLISFATNKKAHFEHNRDAFYDKL